MNHPSSIHEFFIYDIFHSGDEKLVLIAANELGPFPISFKNPITNEFEKLKVITCLDNHTNVYQSEKQIEYSCFFDGTVSLQLHVGETLPLHFTRLVKKYPSFENKIIMSILVKYEDDYIKQWILYNLNLGADHIIVYDNSTDPDESNSLIKLLDSFIQKNQVFLIKWPYKYVFEKTGLSAQTTQQNHSIYAFRKSRAIAFFDIDEYFVFYTHMQIGEFIDEQVSKNKIDLNTISGLSFTCKLFLNPEKKETLGNSFFFIFHCENFCARDFRQKCIVFPKNVDVFSIHKPTHGKEVFFVDPEDGYFNHYFFLNKTNRGFNETRWRDSSIIKHLTFLNLKYF